MASPFTPFGPISGPGSYPQTPNFSSITIPLPGYAYAAGLSPNSIPNPGPPAANIDGLLLEPSQIDFVALETSQGGPASVLVQEP